MPRWFPPLRRLSRLPHIPDKTQPTGSHPRADFIKLILIKRYSELHGAFDTYSFVFQIVRHGRILLLEQGWIFVVDLYLAFYFFATVGFKVNEPSYAKPL